MVDLADVSPEIAHLLKVATSWCRGEGLTLNRNGTGLARLEDALLVPLDPESRQDFGDGAGGELRKMHSLRSSSGLAYNVFAAWKSDPTPIATCLGGTGTYTSLRFERQYPTGVSPRHPHLDVVIDNIKDDTVTPIAVESKFLETYDEPKPASFSPSYLEATQLWDGMPNVRRLGETLAQDPWAFQRLGAAQLVKHTLGLSRSYGPTGFSLIYLWYDFASEAAETHRSETDRFTDIVRADIDFTAMTHQGLLEKLAHIDEPAPGYIKYLSHRYGLR